MTLVGASPVKIRMVAEATGSTLLPLMNISTAVTPHPIAINKQMIAPMIRLVRLRFLGGFFSSLAACFMGRFMGSVVGVPLVLVMTPRAGVEVAGDGCIGCGVAK